MFVLSGVGYTAPALEIPIPMRINLVEEGVGNWVSVGPGFHVVVNDQILPFGVCVNEGLKLWLTNRHGAAVDVWYQNSTRLVIGF